MKKNPKSKRREAEVAAEWYCYKTKDCIKTVRAIKTQWQRQDMFACDVLGKRSNGSLVAIQVTAGQDQAVTARKRKLEDIPWSINDTVQLLQLKQEQDGKSKKWYFKVWEYYYDPSVKEGAWENLKPVTIPKEWFKVYKNSN